MESSVTLLREPHNSQSSKDCIECSSLQTQPVVFDTEIFIFQITYVNILVPDKYVPFKSYPGHLPTDWYCCQKSNLTEAVLTSTCHCHCHKSRSHCHCHKSRTLLYNCSKAFEWDKEKHNYDTAKLLSKVVRNLIPNEWRLVRGDRNLCL